MAQKKFRAKISQNKWNSTHTEKKSKKNRKILEKKEFVQSEAQTKAQ